ncbi:Hydrolase pyvD [Fulvia fulva]|uniref:Hydrolase pyvD n=1 Tax=Passalora fulva TaxID=5499 RepID=A0A9Q8LET1_PASFU|nr:Hydrolase pyvD [Fulvia fulva]UJO16062.1 Hydrolase pyvD [Fulvia fulva]
MSDKVIAKPSSGCCLRGTIHEGEAKGRIEKIVDVETYIAEPSAENANGNIVLFFPDVFGLWINNNLLVDAFAAAGYLTLAPDYFRGDPVWKHKKDLSDTNDNPDFDFPGWLAKHRAFSDPFVPKFVEEVKSKYGKSDTKYTCVGYCYGAPYVMDQLSDKGICSAGAFAHPAFLKESHFENLTKPLFLSCSEIDQTFPKEFRRRAIDIMDEHKKRYSLQLFQEVSHGFALRADLSDDWQKHCKEMSFQGIQEWFDWWSAKK